jgi:hypothetical protein
VTVAFTAGADPGSICTVHVLAVSRDVDRSTDWIAVIRGPGVSLVDHFVQVGIGPGG